MRADSSLTRLEKSAIIPSRYELVARALYRYADSFIDSPISGGLTMRSDKRYLSTAQGWLRLAASIEIDLDIIRTIEADIARLPSMDKSHVEQLAEAYAEMARTPVDYAETMDAFGREIRYVPEPVSSDANAYS